MEKRIITFLAIVLATILLLSSCGSDDLKPFKPGSSAESEDAIAPSTSKEDDSKNSNSTYDEAVELFEKGLFLQAYYKFDEVGYTDEHYDDAIIKKNSAKEKYISDLSNKAISAKTESEVSDALTLINAALDIFPNDAALIASKDTCNASLDTIKFIKIEEAAQKQYKKDIEYISADINASNWASATEKFISRTSSFLDTYESYIADKKLDDNLRFTSSNSSVIAELLNQYIDKISEIYDVGYMEKALSDAEAEFTQNKDYAAAIRVLNKYISKVDDINALMDRIGLHWAVEHEIYEKLNYYNEFIPVYLSEIDRYGIGTGACDFGSESKFCEDINGKTYDYKHTLVSYTIWKEDNPFISYYLNCKYDILTFTMFMPRDCLPFTSFYIEPYFRVYGDDILIYEAPRIDKEHNAPFDVTLDVSGVRVLRVEMGGLYGYLLGDKAPCIAASGWLLKKKIP